MTPVATASASAHTAACSALLLVSDLLMLALALAMATGVRFLLWPLGAGEVLWAPILALSPLQGLYLLSFAISGLYPSFGVPAEEELRRIVRAAAITCLGVGAALFLSHNLAYSRTVFVLSCLFAVVLVPLGRGVLRGFFIRRDWWGYPVVVVGSAKRAAGLIRALAARPDAGLRPVAAAGPDLEADGSVEGVPALGPLENLDTRIHETPRGSKWVQRAVVAPPDGMQRGRINELVAACEARFASVTVIPDFLRFSHYDVEPHDFGGLVGLTMRQPLERPIAQWCKRCVDVLGVVAGLPFVLPVLGVIALAVRLDSPGPAFFRQDRLGQGGHHFRPIKFRTMHEDAQQRLEEVLDADPALREEYERWHKLENDPRVTRVGRFLRKTSLDELPQVFNVLKGEMSLVGPRPYMPEERGEMNGMEDLILEVRPGITGYWQIFDRNRATFQKRLTMDVHYVRHWSIWLDIYLLLRTVDAVLMPRNAC